MLTPAGVRSIASVPQLTTGVVVTGVAAQYTLPTEQVLPPKSGMSPDVPEVAPVAEAPALPRLPRELGAALDEQATISAALLASHIAIERRSFIDGLWPIRCAIMRAGTDFTECELSIDQSHEGYDRIVQSMAPHASEDCLSVSTCCNPRPDTSLSSIPSRVEGRLYLPSQASICTRLRIALRALRVLEKQPDDTVAAPLHTSALRIPALQ